MPMLDCIRHQVRAGGATLALLFLVGTITASERGQPFISWYPPQVYGAGTQNWAITQGDDGVMYFGNDGVVLTFDGARWDRMPILPGRAIRSLAHASDGRILVGTQGDFGYIDFANDGTATYVSLAAHLPDDAPAFSDVWQVIAHGSDWYFASPQALFHLSDGDFHIHSHDQTKAGGTFLVHETLYSDLAGIGLARLGADGYEPLSEAIANLMVHAMVPLPDARILIGTRQSGLFVYNPNNEEIDPIAPDASAFLAEQHVYHGVGLSDGRVALATLRSGVVLVDALTDEFEVIDRRTGLPDIRVWHLFLDDDDGLWLGLDTGIARMESSSVLTRYDGHSGLEGSALSFIRHDGILHAGTTMGLFRLVDGRFEAIEGIASEVWDLAVWTDPDGEQMLFAATTFGIHAITGKTAERISEPYLSTSLAVVPDQRDRLWVGTYDQGLGYLERTMDGWSSTEFSSHDWPIRQLQHGENRTLWVETWLDGVFRVDADDLEVLWRHPPQGTDQESATWTILATNSHRLLASRKGIWQWHDDGSVHPLTELARTLISPHTGAVLLAEGEPGVLWAITTDGVTQRVRVTDITRPDQPHPLDALLSRLQDVEFYTILAEDGNQVWIGGADAIYRIESGHRQPVAGDLQMTYRSISAGPDQLPIRSGDTPQVLNERNFPLTFRFAAPTFDWPDGTRYRHRLPPLQPVWSEWDETAEREFNHLPPGAYQLEVQARDVFGRIASAPPYRIRIPAPWYQTTWALTAVLLIIAGMIPLLLWLGGHRQARQARRLEALVAERTRELQRQKRLLREERDRFDHLSRHDELTELPNRRHGKEQLEQAWQAAVDGGQFVSLALIDVDHFKQINDRLGHDTGDRVLVEIATLLRKSSRPDDVVVRWGGEEFLLLFPGTGLPDAVAICHRISDLIITHDWQDTLEEGGLSVSIGVTATRGQKTVAELLTRADELLYQAKQNGRSRVEVERDNW